MMLENVLPENVLSRPLLVIVKTQTTTKPNLNFGLGLTRLSLYTPTTHHPPPWANPTQNF